MACILLWSSAVRVHDSQAYRQMDVTRKDDKKLDVTYRKMDVIWECIDSNGQNKHKSLPKRKQTETDLPYSAAIDI